jgi:hypothetical protein
MRFGFSGDARTTATKQINRKLVMAEFVGGTSLPGVVRVDDV